MGISERQTVSASVNFAPALYKLERDFWPCRTNCEAETQRRVFPLGSPCNYERQELKTIGSGALEKERTILYSMWSLWKNQLQMMKIFPSDILFLSVKLTEDACETSFNDGKTTFIRRVYLNVLLKTNKMKDGYFACRLHVSKHRPTPKKPDINFPNIDEITPFITVISLFIVKLHNDLAKTGY